MINTCDVIDNELFLVSNDEIINIGEVYSGNGLTNNNIIGMKQIANWYEHVNRHITKQFLIDELKNIDNIIHNLSLSDEEMKTSIYLEFRNVVDVLSPDKFGSVHGFNIFRKIKNYENNDNAIVRFVEYCYSLHNMDLMKILQTKFPNSEIEKSSFFYTIKWK